MSKGILVLFLLTVVTYVNAQGKWPPPPWWMEKTKMARYIVHYADWGIVSAVSPDYGLVPFGTVQSFADGTMENSTGVPYLYIDAGSDTGKNLRYNNSASLALSQAQSDYCASKGLDPEQPTCARITLIGQLIPVKDVDEASFAKVALFSRHPAMKSWPASHDWAFYKLNVTAICLLDYYGGPSHISLKDYFSTKP